MSSVVKTLSFSVVDSTFHQKFDDQQNDISPPPYFNSTISDSDHRLQQQRLQEEVVGAEDDDNDDFLGKRSFLSEGDDLFVSLKKLLWLGAALGLIPIRGLMGPRTGTQIFSWFHWRTMLTIIISFFIGSNVIFIGNGFILFLTDKERQSAGELVQNGSGVWFYAAGFSVYLFFLLRSPEVCEYFYTWRRISRRIHETLKPDVHIRRDVSLITGIILGSCIGENIMFHFYIMKESSRDKLAMGTLPLSEFLLDYYDSNSYMYHIFDYNPILAIFLFVTNKLTLLAWNLSDVFIMVMSRAIFSRFETFNLFLESKMVPDGSIKMIERGSVSWKMIRDNFLLINKLLEEANRIFSPLIWLSYTTDIFFVCNQLYIQLSTNPIHQPSIMNSIYVLWSFFHLLVRTLAVNMMAAKINENAHRLSHILQHCYPEEYDNDVRRLEQYLASHVIGLSGSGCFVITRSFILMIISAIFTLEVVLLQNSSLVVA